MKKFASILLTVIIIPLAALADGEACAYNSDCPLSVDGKLQGCSAEAGGVTDAEALLKNGKCMPGVFWKSSKPGSDSDKNEDNQFEPCVNPLAQQPRRGVFNLQLSKKKPIPNQEIQLCTEDGCVVLNKVNGSFRACTFFEKVRARCNFTPPTPQLSPNPREPKCVILPNGQTFCSQPDRINL